MYLTDYMLYLVDKISVKEIEKMKKINAKIKPFLNYTIKVKKK